MGKSVLYMSMSVDGFIAGPNATADNGLGDGGTRLHEWFLQDSAADPEHRSGSHLAGVNREIMDEAMRTGAVVVGRRTFEYAGGWGGDHHDGVPIYVLSRSAPEPALTWPGVTYVGDIVTAMSLARDAAGDKDILVHGARTARLALAAGVLDELQIHLIPVLLGQGEPLFEEMPAEQVELELLRAVDAPGVTHLRYRVHGAQAES